MSCVGPSFEITRFGRLIPGVGLRLENAGDVVGQASPAVGTATEMKVVAVPAVAVRLNTAAAAVPSVGTWGVVSDMPGGTPETLTRRQVFPVNGALLLPVAVAHT